MTACNYKMWPSDQRVKTAVSQSKENDIYPVKKKKAKATVWALLHYFELSHRYGLSTLMKFNIL